MTTANHSPSTTEDDKSLQESDSLSPEQERAISLLLAGLSDQKVADAIGRHRVTVTKWRLYDPHFRDALLHRRRRLWQHSIDGLRSLLPGALEALRDQLNVAPNRGKLALDLLAKAGLMGKPYSGRLGSPELEMEEEEDENDADPSDDGPDTNLDTASLDPESHPPVSSRMASFS